jgi:hypothetical protein
VCVLLVTQDSIIVFVLPVTQHVLIVCLQLYINLMTYFCSLVQQSDIIMACIFTSSTRRYHCMYIYQ